jgi:exopolysaccharide biosynthesis polyprenyl glycosylphosphotransferase
MLKQYNSILRRLMLTTDLAFVCLSFFVAYPLISRFKGNLSQSQHYYILIPVLLLVWGICLDSYGMYRSLRTKSLLETYFILFKAGLTAFMVVPSIAYLMHLSSVSRLLVVAIFAVSCVLIVIEKTILLLFFRHIRREGFNYRQVLVAGSGKQAQRFIDLLDRQSEWGLRVLGVVTDDVSRTGEMVNGHRVLGTLDDIPEIIHNNVVDEVVFAVPRSWLNKIEDCMHVIEQEGIRMHLAVDHFELKLAHARLNNDFSGFPLLTFESTPDKAWHLLLKRVFDVGFSLGSLIATMPILLAVAALIKLTSRGPVFYRQQRCGLSGRKFSLIKFRTMVEGADEKLGELEYANEMKGPTFKMTDDPRVTPLGRFLRKFSIDELPQMYNVLIGEMSLVGPRPPRPHEVQNYDNWHRRRLSMRPGLTCLWQVMGRSRIKEFDTWVKLDLEYIDKWSLLLDAKIFLKTIPVVLLGIGAR